MILVSYGVQTLAKTVLEILVCAYSLESFECNDGRKMSCGVSEKLSFVISRSTLWYFRKASLVFLEVSFGILEKLSFW